MLLLAQGRRQPGARVRLQSRSDLRPVPSHHHQHGTLPRGQSSPCPFAGLNASAVSCFRLKLVLEMLRFHLNLLPDPASSATWKSGACTAQARGLVATVLHPMCHRGRESGCLREGQTGAQHNERAARHRPFCYQPCPWPWHRALVVQLAKPCLRTQLAGNSAFWGCINCPRVQRAQRAPARG